MAHFTHHRFNKYQQGKTHLEKGYCLRHESALTLLHAERFARELGKPFTHAVTINLAGRYKAGKDAWSLFQLIRTNLQNAWRRRNRRGEVDGEFFYSAVFENPEYGRYFGEVVYGPLHVHMMMHWATVRTSLAEQIIRRALKKYMYDWFEGRLDIEKLYNPIGYAMYQAKGIDPPYAKHYHLRHRPQGPVPFKRIRVSNALNERAQRAYEKARGHHRFYNADQQRVSTSTSISSGKRRTRLKPLTPWRKKTYRSPLVMKRLSPQKPF